MRSNVSLKEGVETEQYELVATNKSADEVHEEQLDFEFLSWLPQLLEELLSQGLRIVDQLDGGEQRSALRCLAFIISTQLSIVLHLSVDESHNSKRQLYQFITESKKESCPLC